jgi:hypothetical protein
VVRNESLSRIGDYGEDHEQDGQAELDRPDHSQDAAGLRLSPAPQRSGAGPDAAQRGIPDEIGDRAEDAAAEDAGNTQDQRRGGLTV